MRKVIVVSNALLIKAAYPEMKVSVGADCCAGVSPESHKNALEAMKMCQVQDYMSRRSRSNRLWMYQN